MNGWNRQLNLICPGEPLVPLFWQCKLSSPLRAPISHDTKRRQNALKHSSNRISFGGHRIFKGWFWSKSLQYLILFFFYWQLLYKSKDSGEIFPYLQHNVTSEKTRFRNTNSSSTGLSEVKVNSEHEFTRERIVSSQSSSYVVEVKISSMYLPMYEVR